MHLTLRFLHCQHECVPFRSRLRFTRGSESGVAAKLDDMGPRLCTCICQVPSTEQWSFGANKVSDEVGWTWSDACVDAKWEHGGRDVRQRGNNNNEMEVRPNWTIEARERRKERTFVSADRACRRCGRQLRRKIS